MTNAAATYIANNLRASRLVWEQARKAGDRATEYHHRLVSAASLVSAAFDGEGLEGVYRLQLELVASDADGTVLAEVRRLYRGIGARTEASRGPVDGW
jgi:hypothetical protein